jgi:hypothetical protein
MSVKVTSYIQVIVLELSTKICKFNSGTPTQYSKGMLSNSTPDIRVLACFYKPQRLTSCVPHSENNGTNMHSTTIVMSKSFQDKFKRAGIAQSV